MRLLKIELTDFMQFSGKHEFSFEAVNFIRGKIGVGKSTLVNYAVNFCLFGNPSRDKKLEDCPTKGQTSCIVKITLLINNEQYKIVRKYPTEIRIYKNEQELINLKTPLEKNKCIEKLIGDLNNFRKFRMVDKENGTDILDEGNTSIKKTLFAYDEELLNKLKDSLNTERTYRNQYLNIQSEIRSCYPSKKRLNILTAYYQETDIKLLNTKNDLRENLKLQNSYLYKRGQTERTLKILEQNKDKLQIENKCYICNNLITVENKIELLKNIENQYNELENELGLLKDEIHSHELYISYLEEEIEHLELKFNKLNYYQNRLNNVLNQKQNKFTDKDIVIVKEALKELDKFSNNHLIESMKSLEPIVNSILEKIGYTLEFELNEKGDFNLNFYKDGIQYKRSDFSTGQKLILQIAFKLALMIQRQETGLIICDEGFSNLDEESVLNILQLFQTMTHMQLIVVLHRFNDIPVGVKIIDLNK